MLKVMQKLQNSKLKKVFAVCMCLLVCCSSLVPMAFAADGTAVSDPTPKEAATQIFDSIYAELNFTTILSVLGVAIGAALAVFLGWWSIRKVTRMVMNAFSKGKVSI